MRLWKDKCTFLSPSVDILGHRIDADGHYSMENKQAQVTKNIVELMSFLGLLNYCGCFIQLICSLTSTQLFVTKVPVEVDSEIGSHFFGLSKNTKCFSRICFNLWGRSSDFPHYP